MREMRYVEAIRTAMAEEMAKDENIVLMGQDIGLGFVWQVTAGLVDRFGPDRVRDTPMSELATVGIGVGAALAGLKPVVEIQFQDFVTLAMDQIVNQAAKYRFMTGGQAEAPLIIRLPMGIIGSFAAQHSQCLHTWFCHIPGLRVAVPSTPHDAYGLMKWAMRKSRDPVVFIEHKKLYKTSGPVPDEEALIEFGKADVKRKGKDVTVVGISLMAQRSLEAARILEKEGIDVCVIDPRTLSPLDDEPIIESVRETGRLVVVDEGCYSYGAAAEIVSRVAEKALDYLDAPIARVAALDVPIPYEPRLEEAVVPSVDRIAEAIRKACQ